LSVQSLETLITISTLTVEHKSEIPASREKTIKLSKNIICFLSSSTTHSSDCPKPLHTQIFLVSLLFELILSELVVSLEFNQNPNIIPYNRVPKEEELWLME
jgi:hypothetical protein